MTRKPTETEPSDESDPQWRLTDSPVLGDFINTLTLTGFDTYWNRSCGWYCGEERLHSAGLVGHLTEKGCHHCTSPAEFTVTIIPGPMTKH